MLAATVAGGLGTGKTTFLLRRVDTTSSQGNKEKETPDSVEFFFTSSQD